MHGFDCVSLAYFLSTYGVMMFISSFMIRMLHASPTWAGVVYEVEYPLMSITLLLIAVGTFFCNFRRTIPRNLEA